jgi:hypothetical protein
VYNTIFIEDMKRPAVALCNKGFVFDATSAASGKGMPGLRIVAESVPCECTLPEQIEAGVSAAMADIVTALTQPLSSEERSPKPREAEKLQGVVFKGSLKEVNRFFYKRGWADGLPIVPPTPEEVSEMLTGTDLAPDHVVAEIPPRMGKATVEKIAINAAMAGALPTYMPVLIAGVKAVADPKSYFGTYGVSTGSWAPFWIMNGPLRHDLHVNSGSGALSPGDVANAAIGRAMGLIIKNIGGVRKGIEDMSSLGNPGKYTMLIAENEEETPWEPLHVEQGFNKEESTVSLFFPNYFAQIKPYGTEDKGILQGVISNLIPGRRGLCCIILVPPLARTLAGKGWTKKEIASFVSEYARVPAVRHMDYWGSGSPGEHFWRAPFNSNDSMGILRDPNWIRILVAGGPGNFIGLLVGGSIARDLEWVTKRVDLPANWNKLVNKYKDVVPTYVRY